MTATEAVAPSRIARIAEHPAIRFGVPLLVAAIAILVLHRLATEVSWADVKRDIAAVPRWRLAGAVLAMVASYAAVSQLDVLALRAIGAKEVPRWVASATGAAGIAIAGLLGFSYLTGMSVRYRVYAGMGVDMARVAGVFATGWLAYALAIALIAGLLLTLHPAGVQDYVVLSPWLDTAIGILLLAALGAVGWRLWAGGHEIRWHGWSYRLPDARVGAALTAVSLVDVAMTALVLYLLLPPDLAAGPVQVFIVFLIAIALGILSHAPGGLGVFEAMIIAGLGAGGRSDVLAALVMYRLVYTVLPFALACLGLVAAWGVSHRDRAQRLARASYRGVLPIAPAMAAGVATLAGVVLLVSGSLPEGTGRLRVLGDLLPLSFIEASHLLGSVAGLLLLVVARGLWRRLRRAWIIAFGLMVAGALAALAKRFDWPEAVALAASLGALIAFRPAFYRSGGASVLRLTGSWLVSLAVLLAAITWLGVFAHSHVDYSTELWWRFALQGDASRFLRASLVTALILAGLALDTWLGRSGGRVTAEPVPDAVRALVAASPDTESAIALTGDKAFLLAEDGRAFLAYADTGHALISKGDPVGAPDAAQGLIWQLREKADRMGRRCAFYAVSPAYLPTYLDLGLHILKIGEVARVDLSTFSVDGSKMKELRYARGRAAREGYDFVILPRGRVPDTIGELRQVSEAWLRGKQGAEKGFALGAFDPAYLANFDHALLRHRETGRIAAFGNILQGAGRRECSVDLMRHDPAVTGVTMDALFVELMLWAKGQGFAWFNLGAAPFAGIESRQLASVWNRMGAFAYEHGERLYHVKGLRAFKQKFHPVWSPNYLASPGGMAAPRILYDVNVLISGGVTGLLK